MNVSTAKQRTKRTKFIHLQSHFCLEFHIIRVLEMKCLPSPYSIVPFVKSML